MATKSKKKARAKKSTRKTTATGKNAKFVYAFGKKTDGNAKMRELLGGKGANLAEMARIGLPVPPGFTITTDVCTYFTANKKSFPTGMDTQVRAAVGEMQKQTGKKFGDPNNPLLVSCRSGAKFSMPGMMDTVLNIGLNDETAVAMVTGGWPGVRDTAARQAEPIRVDGGRRCGYQGSPAAAIRGE